MKELDATQVEQLKTIGAYLGRERKERGVSLDEIAVKTYIPLRLLQALEEGQIERLPEPVFVQGFIRRHADAIGLDGVALAKTFSPQPLFVVERKAPEWERPRVEPPLVVEQPMVDSPIEPKAVEPSPVAESVAQPIAKPIAEPSYVPPEYIQRDPPRARRSYLPWALLGTAVALLLGAGLVNVLNRPQPTTESQEAATTTAQSSPDAPIRQPSVATSPASSPAPQASLSPSATTPAQAETAPATDSPVQVAVNLTGDSWFQVITDGKTEFEGILKKGEQKTWTAQKTLVLQAGNAGAVSVAYNQGEAKLMGAPGEVKDLTFTAAKASKTDAAN